jgi:hypothetical protein
MDMARKKEKRSIGWLSTVLLLNNINQKHVIMYYFVTKDKMEKQKNK